MVISAGLHFEGYHISKGKAKRFLTGLSLLNVQGKNKIKTMLGTLQIQNVIAVGCCKKVASKG